MSTGLPCRFCRGSTTLPLLAISFRIFHAKWVDKFFVDQMMRHGNIRRQLVFRIFFCKYAMAVLVFIFLHQSMIALSIVFLTRAVESFQRGIGFEKELHVYFLFMVLPYLPGYLSFLSLRLWVNSAHKRYVEELVSFLQENDHAYGDAVLRKGIESAVSRNSFMILEDALSFIHSFFGLMLNSFLSIFVIGWVLPGNIFYGYLISLMLCAMLIAAARSWIGKAAVETERSFINYGDLLGKIWPNIVLKNSINQQAWHAAFRCSSSDYYRKTFAWELKKQSVNILLAAFALLPTACLLLVAFGGERSASLIAALMVNLTRIFHILSSLSALVSEGMDWSSIGARVNFLLDFFLKTVDSQSMSGVISDEMTINGISLVDVPDSLREIRGQLSGRYTVRGSNGAGKTTFLLAVKRDVGDKAIYFSPYESGLVWPGNIDAGSTGQLAMHGLRKAMDERKTTHLLLDEWDANLDKSNRESIDEILEKEAKTRVIVEVRH